MKYVLDVPSSGADATVKMLNALFCFYVCMSVCTYIRRYVVPHGIAGWNIKYQFIIWFTGQYSG